MSKSINIQLSEDECIVLEYLLASRLDFPKKTKILKRTKQWDFSNLDFAEKVVLANLLATLEPLVDVIFSPDFLDYLEAAKKRLTEGHDPKHWK